MSSRPIKDSFQLWWFLLDWERGSKKTAFEGMKDLIKRVVKETPPPTGLSAEGRVKDGTSIESTAKAPVALSQNGKGTFNVHVKYSR